MNSFAIYFGQSRSCSLVCEDVKSILLSITSTQPKAVKPRYVELENTDTTLRLSGVRPTTLKNNKISKRIQQKLDRRVWANFN